MKAIHHRWNTPAGRVFVREHPGPDHTPTVLLLHGWGRSGTTWERLWSPLGDAFRLVAPDLPGFGRSSACELLGATADLVPFRRAVRAVMEHLEGAPTSPSRDRSRALRIIGHGLGGAIAMDYAAHHPRQVDRLVLVSPSSYRRPSPTGLRGSPSWARLRWPGCLLGQPEVLRLLLRRHHLDPHRPSEHELERLLRDLRRPGHLAAAWRTLVLDVDPGIDPIPPRIQAPTDLVWGLNDRVNPLDHARRLEQEIPNARLRLIPHCDHLPHETRPRSFVDHLSRAWEQDLPIPEPDGHPARWAVPYSGISGGSSTEADSRKPA